jgi:glutamate 5-kinase
MNETKRQLPEIKRLIIKVGSSSLCHKDGKIDPSRIVEITRQVAFQAKRGIDVILVSSGAVASGRNLLKEFGNRPSIVNKQAAAAIGQPILMGYYQQYFQAYNLKAAQVLLTHDDLDNRRRYLNARNTLNNLIENGIIPIINENDTVSVKGIQFSDNDFLGALCTNMISADLFIILSDIDGIAEADPKENPDAEIYSTLSLTKLRQLQTQNTNSSVRSFGRGGIVTKLTAPYMAAQYGVPTIIANSQTRDVIYRLLDGENLGTLITPKKTELNSWKAYIAHALKSRAAVIIDEGASNAVTKRKASLLASGVIRAENKFNRGDGVRCCLEDGTEIARGIVEYNSEEINKIAGRQSKEIEKILGFQFRRGVIHRDNMVITEVQ